MFTLAESKTEVTKLTTDVNTEDDKKHCIRTFKAFRFRPLHRKMRLESEKKTTKPQNKTGKIVQRLYMKETNLKGNK